MPPKKKTSAKGHPTVNKSRLKPGKTTPKKKSTSARKSARKTQARKNASAERNFNPLYALTIMILITIIIFLTDRAYFGESRKNNTDENNNRKRVHVTTAEKKTRDLNKKPVDENKVPSDKKSGDIIDAKIYFVRLNEQTEKIYLSPVVRKISSRNRFRGALMELISGVTPTEEKRGFLNAVPPDLKIRDVRIREGVAELDFNGSIERGANGNILLSRIDQVVYTMTQFDDIDSVMIKINGRKRKTLGSDGLSISGPLHRRY